MNRKKTHPRTLIPDPEFTPAVLREGDEYYANGIFEFNITMILEYIRSNPDQFKPENISVPEFNNDFSVIDESYIDSVTFSEPVILAEIAPERFNLIDGNHRMEKAKRLGLKVIMAYKLSPVHHVMFLTSQNSYDKYISYWNDKLVEL